MTTPSARDRWLRRTRTITGLIAGGSLAGVGLFAALAAQSDPSRTAVPAVSASRTGASSASTGATSTAVTSTGATSTSTTLQPPTTTPTTSSTATTHATSGGS